VFGEAGVGAGPIGVGIEGAAGFAAAPDLDGFIDVDAGVDIGFGARALAAGGFEFVFPLD
jgi:hypothetical protein